jgi:type IV pilus biogenesis protein CpaD/CtpE
MAQQRVELAHDQWSSSVPTASLDAAALRTIGEHYQSAGEGPVEVVVTYDPHSPLNTAAHASNEAQRIKTALNRRGVGNVDADILPINGQGNISTTTIDYGILVAQAPSACGSMPGLDGRQTEADLDYKMGCGLETQIARQIANPRDLQGRTGLDTADGRRQTNVTGVYMAAKPLPPLDSAETTTGD